MTKGSEMPEDGFSQESAHEIVQLAAERHMASSDLFWFVKSIIRRESDPSFGQAHQPKSPDTTSSRNAENVRRFLNGVSGAIEATDVERHGLMEKYTRYGVTWKSNTGGLLTSVGALGDMPVCISLNKAKIDGQSIIFYHATSQVVDHRMVRKWLEDNLPSTARREDGRIKHADAMNADLVAPFAASRPEQGSLTGAPGHTA